MMVVVKKSVPDKGSAKKSARKKSTLRRSSASSVTKKHVSKKRNKSVRIKKSSSDDDRISVAKSHTTDASASGDVSSAHHNEIVRRMLTESSPKKQRAMLRRCITKLRQVTEACRPRSGIGSIVLIFLGMVIGVAVFLGYLYVSKNTALVDLLVRGGSIEVHGVSLRIDEEVDPFFVRSTPPDRFSSVNLDDFWEVWQRIEHNFIPKPEKVEEGGFSTYEGDDVTRDDLVNGAIKGLTFATEDPYTNFFLPKDALEFEDEVIEGEIEGIGAYLTINDDDFLEVVRPIADSPAAGVGLRPGDIITAIEGVSSSRYSLSEAASAIRGPSGTTVVLEIYRSVVDETFEVSIVRGSVEIPTVETESRDGVFIITLSTFTRQTPEAFRTALEEFVASANTGGPDRLLLDMRGNMGGILSVSVYIASLFLPEHSVVLYEYSGTEHLKVYKTGKPAFRGGVIPKITILVDGATASASEILAAALRYYGVADIVGQKTLGKGSVQAIQHIGDEHALLKITVAHWLTPAKESISDEGLDLDVDYTKELKEMYKKDQSIDISEIALQKAISHLKNK